MSLSEFFDNTQDTKRQALQLEIKRQTSKFDSPFYKMDEAQFARRMNELGVTKYNAFNHNAAVNGLMDVADSFAWLGNVTRVNQGLGKVTEGTVSLFTDDKEILESSKQIGQDAFGMFGRMALMAIPGVGVPLAATLTAADTVSSSQIGGMSEGDAWATGALGAATMGLTPMIGKGLSALAPKVLQKGLNTIGVNYAGKSVASRAAANTFNVAFRESGMFATDIANEIGNIAIDDRRKMGEIFEARTFVPMLVGASMFTVGEAAFHAPFQYVASKKLKSYNAGVETLNTARNGEFQQNLDLFSSDSKAFANGDSEETFTIADWKRDKKMFEDQMYDVFTTNTDVETIGKFKIIQTIEDRLSAFNAHEQKTITGFVDAYVQSARPDAANYEQVRRRGLAVVNNALLRHGDFGKAMLAAYGNVIDKNKITFKDFPKTLEDTPSVRQLYKLHEKELKNGSQHVLYHNKEDDVTVMFDGSNTIAYKGVRRVGVTEVDILAKHVEGINAGLAEYASDFAALQRGAVDNGGVSFSKTQVKDTVVDDIPFEYQELIKSVHKGFGIDIPLHVTTFDAASRPAFAAFKDWNGKGNGVLGQATRVTYQGSGLGMVHLENNQVTPQNTLTLLHELGHHVMYAKLNKARGSFNNASPVKVLMDAFAASKEVAVSSVKQAESIFNDAQTKLNEFNKKKSEAIAKANKNKTTLPKSALDKFDKEERKLITQVNTSRSNLTTRQTETTIGAKQQMREGLPVPFVQRNIAQNYNGKVETFSEWFANQFARWMTDKTAKPNGVIDNLFKDMHDTFAGIYKQQGVKNINSSDFVSFMDREARRFYSELVGPNEGLFKSLREKYLLGDEQSDFLAKAIYDIADPVFERTLIQSLDKWDKNGRKGNSSNVILDAMQAFHHYSRFINVQPKTLSSPKVTTTPPGMVNVKPVSVQSTPTKVEDVKLEVEAVEVKPEVFPTTPKVKEVAKKKKVKVEEVNKAVDSLMERIRVKEEAARVKEEKRLAELKSQPITKEAQRGVSDVVEYVTSARLENDPDLVVKANRIGLRWLLGELEWQQGVPGKLEEIGKLTKFMENEFGHTFADKDRQKMAYKGSGKFGSNNEDGAGIKTFPDKISAEIYADSVLRTDSMWAGRDITVEKMHTTKKHGERYKIILRQNAKLDSRQFDTMYNLGETDQFLTQAQMDELDGFLDDGVISDKLDVGSQDVTYAAAVKSKDIKTAQALVDAAATAAGYVTKAYHGTRTEWTVWNMDKFGGLINTADNATIAEKYAQGGGGYRAAGNPDIIYGEVVWKADETNAVYSDQKGNKMTFQEARRFVEENDEDVELKYSTGKVLGLRIKTKNTLDLTQPEGIKVLAGLKFTTRHGQSVVVNARNGVFYWDTTKHEAVTKHWRDEIVPQLIQSGYDSIKFKDDTHTTVAVFSPDQIKSAAPITYENGAIIPPSARFNKNSKNINYLSLTRQSVDFSQMSILSNPIANEVGNAAIHSDTTSTLHTTIYKNIINGLHPEIKQATDRAVVRLSDASYALEFSAVAKDLGVKNNSIDDMLMSFIQKIDSDPSAVRSLLLNSPDEIGDMFRSVLDLSLEYGKVMELGEKVGIITDQRVERTALRFVDKAHEAINVDHAKEQMARIIKNISPGGQANRVTELSKETGTIGKLYRAIQGNVLHLAADNPALAPVATALNNEMRDRNRIWTDIKSLDFADDPEKVKGHHKPDMVNQVVDENEKVRVLLDELVRIENLNGKSVEQIQDLPEYQEWRSKVDDGTFKYIIQRRERMYRKQQQFGRIYNDLSTEIDNTTLATLLVKKSGMSPNQANQFIKTLRNTDQTQIGQLIAESGLQPDLGTHLLSSMLRLDKQRTDFVQRVIKDKHFVTERRFGEFMIRYSTTDDKGPKTGLVSFNTREEAEMWLSDNKGTIVISSKGIEQRPRNAAQREVGDFKEFIDSSAESRRTLLNELFSDVPEVLEKVDMLINDIYYSADVTAQLASNPAKFTNRKFKPGREQLDTLEQQDMFINSMLTRLTRSRTNAIFNLTKLIPDFQTIKGKELMQIVEKSVKGLRLPDTDAGRLGSKVGFGMTMMFNASSWLTNLGSLVAVVPPSLMELGEGMVGAGRSLTKAMNDTKNYLVDRHGEFDDKNVPLILKRLEDEGLASARHTVDLEDSVYMADLKKGRERGGNVVKSVTERVYEMGANMFAASDKTAAYVSVLAAYNSLKKLNPKMGLEELYQKSVEFHIRTNGAGGKITRPYVIADWEGTARTLAQSAHHLQSFSQAAIANQLRWFKKGYVDPVMKRGDKVESAKARKAFNVMAGITVMTTGLTGFAGVGAVNKLIEKLFKVNGEEELSKWLEESFEDEEEGQFYANLGMRGMMYAFDLPIDLQSRFSVGGMYGFNQFDGYKPESLFGGFGIAGESVMKMSDALVNGDVGKAFEAVVPAGLRRAVNMWNNEGLLRPSSNVAFAPDMAESIGAVLGFTPLRLRKEYDELSTKEYFNQRQNITKQRAINKAGELVKEGKSEEAKAYLAQLASQLGGGDVEAIKKHHTSLVNSAALRDSIMLNAQREQALMSMGLEPEQIKPSAAQEYLTLMQQKALYGGNGNVDQRTYNRKLNQDQVLSLPQQPQMNNPFLPDTLAQPFLNPLYEAGLW